MLTLLPMQSVQVPFLEVHGIKVLKEYQIRQSFSGGNPYFSDSGGTQVPIETFLTFKNTESDNLGRQLPGGRVRLYQPDANGVLRYLGDTEVPESVSGMEVRLGLGPASDLTAKKRIVDYRVVDDPSPKRSTEEKSIEFMLTNRKDEPQAVHIQVNISGDWSLVSSSHPGRREQANILGFKVQVPAKGRTKVECRVKTRLNRAVPVE
jgi:hypothetical protein